MERDDPNEARKRVNRERQRRLRARKAEAQAAEVAAAEAVRLTAEINARGRGRGRGREGGAVGRGCGVARRGAAVCCAESGARVRGGGRAGHVVNHTDNISNTTSTNTNNLSTEAAQTSFLTPPDASLSVRSLRTARSLDDGTPLSRWSTTPDPQPAGTLMVNVEDSQHAATSMRIAGTSHMPQYGLDFGRQGRDGPFALDVIVAWTATEGNIAQFRISDTMNKRLLAMEIIEKLREHGMAERTADSVVDKIDDCWRRSCQVADTLRNSTGEGVMEDTNASIEQMLSNDNNGKIYLQLRDILADRHGVNPLAFHESTTAVTQYTREETIRLMLRGMSQEPSTSDEEDAPGEDDPDAAGKQAGEDNGGGEDWNNDGQYDEDADDGQDGPSHENNEGRDMGLSSTRANPSHLRRPDGASNNTSRVPPASSPFAPAATPTPATDPRQQTATKNKRKTVAAAVGIPSAAPIALGTTGPAARNANASTTYDRSVAAGHSSRDNAASSSTARNKAKSKEKEDVGSTIREGFSTYQKTVREHDAKKEERLAKKQKLLGSRLELEQERDKREAAKHNLEMEEQRKVLEELEPERRAKQIKEFLYYIDIDFGIELAGELAFAARWDSVKPTMERIVANREAAQKRVNEKAVRDGETVLDRSRGQSTSR